MRLPHFIGPDYQGQALTANAQRTMNWAPEVSEVDGGKNQIQLAPTPGVVNPAFAEFTETTGRGLYDDRGALFAVIGQTLYEVGSTGTKTSRGTMATDSNPATIVGNGDGGGEVFVTSGGAGYIWDVVTSAFTTEVASGVTMGGHLDGFFFYLDGSTSKLFISDLLDGKTWDATQFLQRSDAADNWKAVIEQGGEIWAIGGKTGGVLYNSGGSPYPFVPRPEAFFERGIEAPFSLTRFHQSVAWLGSSAQGSGEVYIARGYTPTRISNHAMERELQTYDKLDDCIGWSYEQSGHHYLVLEFPTADRTWVFDDTTGMWHRRGKLDRTTGKQKAWRPRYQASIFTKTLVCDGAKGAIYELSETSGLDVDAELIRRVRRAPHLAQENKQITIDEFQVECESGLGSNVTNLLDINQAEALGQVYGWLLGAGVTSIERVVLATEGLPTLGLPTGVKTAYKVTMNGSSTTLVKLPQVLTVALYDISAYVLAGGTWSGRPNLLADPSGFAGASAGTTAAVTPNQLSWTRTSEPVTPVAGDLVGDFVINGNGSGSFTTGDIFYFTAARVELDAAPLPAPYLMFRYSKNGGNTFSNERRVSVGPLGNFDARAIFRRMGMGRNWVFEVATTERLRLIDAYLEARPGAH